MKPPKKFRSTKSSAGAKQPGTNLLVCLVGVQTNQFPRAVDMARQFQSRRASPSSWAAFTPAARSTCWATRSRISRNCYREGICVVSGEVEGKWEGILADFLHGQLKPLYSFAQDLQNLVDIDDAPLPQDQRENHAHFAYPSFATADTSRGCPFSCSFCTIINVQGRKMRERSPESIAAMMRRNYVDHGLIFLFFHRRQFRAQETLARDLRGNHQAARRRASRSPS